MKIKIFITITLLLCSFINYSQSYSFYTTYSASNGGSIQYLKRTLDNNLVYLLEDYVSKANYIVKTDTNGNFIWQTKLISPYQQISKGLIQTSDSNYIILENSYLPNNNGPVTLIKIDKSGNCLWSRKYNYNISTEAYSLTQTENGGFAILCGGCSGGLNIVKFDNNGTIIWNFNYFANQNTSYTGNAIIYNNDNSIVIAGQEVASSTINNCFLLKINTNGEIIWFKIYHFPFNAFVKGIVKTLDGGYTVCGYSYIINSTFNKPFIFHTDNAGDLFWAKEYNTNNRSLPNSIVQLSDNNYILSGTYFAQSPVDAQMLDIKTDAQGNFIWAHVMGNNQNNGNYNDMLLSSVYLNNNTYITAGYAYADYAVLIKNNGAEFENCKYQSVIFSDNQVTVSFISNSITKSPLNYISDTILITQATSNLIKNVICDSYQSGTDENKYDEFTIYPNPFTNNTLIEINRNYKNASLIIYNSFGQIVKEVRNINSNTFLLNRENLNNGLYFIKLTQENKTLAIKKCIISDY